jgi:hypothetical protein
MKRSKILKDENINGCKILKDENINGCKILKDVKKLLKYL